MATYRLSSPPSSKQHIRRYGRAVSARPTKSALRWERRVEAGGKRDGPPPWAAVTRSPGARASRCGVACASPACPPHRPLPSMVLPARARALATQSNPPLLQVALLPAPLAKTRRPRLFTEVDAFPAFRRLMLFTIKMQTWPRCALGRPFHSGGALGARARPERAFRSAWASRCPIDGPHAGGGPASTPHAQSISPPVHDVAPRNVHECTCVGLARVDAREACECWNHATRLIIPVMWICGSPRGSLGDRRNRVARMAR